MQILRHLLFVIIAISYTYLSGVSCTSSKGKIYPHYRAIGSVLTGYKTFPRNLSHMDNYGYLRLWYKDIYSYKKEVFKKARLVFEKKNITVKRVLNYPIGGLLLLEVSRGSRGAAHMDKFMVIIKKDGKTILRKTLSDTNVKPKQLEAGYTFWNAEPIALNFPVYSSFEVYVVDLIHNKRYRFVITPLNQRKHKTKKLINNFFDLLKSLKKRNEDSNETKII